MRGTVTEMAEWNPVAHTLTSVVWLLVAECVTPSILQAESLLLPASCNTRQ